MTNQKPMPHKWEDMPQRNNAMVNVVIGSKAQKRLYCRAERIVQEVEDHIHVVGTTPLGLSDECPGKPTK